MKRVLLLTILFIAVTAMVFAGGKKEKSDYVFAADCTWPPLEFVDESGTIVGFEIDLIAAISEKSGVSMVTRNVAWDGIFAGLDNGAYDGVASGVTITEERKNTMDFTTPILEVTQSIIVNKGNKNIKDESSLQGKKVGVQIGTTGNFAVEKVDGAVIRAYDDIGLAIEDLLNKNVDAAVADSLIAAEFVLANANYADKLEIIGSMGGEKEEIAIAVKKGNTELLKLLNDSLAGLENDGTMATLKQKWDIL
ncbi:MAG: basic amino acid ABC transporter substrate-binding protein [Sphaerochaetaceae bacterium]